jgi:hypothetical protein
MNIPISLAPICLFVYNRPSHTKRVLDKLSKAKLADSSELFIFCDGPRENASDFDIININQVREIVKNENRFASVIIQTAEKNRGLGQSIIKGVSEILSRYDRIIVLEDDHLVHSDFLIYMNFYLETYKLDKRVMHISGFQRDSWVQFFLPRIFFSRHMDCWGWATWSDRWQFIVTDIKFIDRFLSIPYNLGKLNFGILERHKQFDLNRNGLKTWAIFWSSTIIIYNGLTVKPRFSYVKNIGNDGSGTNNVVKGGELASNFVKKFRVSIKKPNENFLSKLYIRDAYAKRSQKRLTTVKKIIFFIFTKARSFVIKQGI